MTTSKSLQPASIFTRRCRKKSGHHKFIPAETFQLVHLPEGFRDQELYQFIKATAGLTVKINVKCTSSRRPRNWPGTSVPFPGYEQKGRSIPNMGSGRIRSVYHYSNGADRFGNQHWKKMKHCVCHRCKVSRSPNRKWAEVVVVTAAHVVYDEDEASGASCTLFYDGPGSDAVAMNTVVSESVRLDRDVSWIRCITCDAELTRKLEDDIRRFRHFFWSAGKLYGKSHNDQKLAVIVSHPHGCFKQISIGQWVSIQSEDGHMHRFTYTACTCPGSSGGPVNIVGCDGHWGWGLIHSQALKSGQNRSGRGRRWEQFPTCEV